MRLFPRAVPALLLAVSSLVADTPTIQNGDFEMPRIGPPFVSVVAVPGWNHLGCTGIGNLMRVGFIDYEDLQVTAGHGSQFLLMGCGPDLKGDASWSTQITGLTPGVTYTLGFLMSSQAPRSATTLMVSFPSGSSTASETFMVSPFDFAYWANWEQKQMNFVATAASATVLFSIFEQPSELGLDYVTVVQATPVVLPPSLTSVDLPIVESPILAPGVPMLITGANLGTGPSDVATISIGGEAAPLISFLNSSNLLAQVPLDLPVGTNSTVTATHAGMTSNAVGVIVNQFSPKIYYPGASAFADSAGNPINPTHLAIPGTSVTCVAIGLGPTNPPMVTGVAAATAAPTTTPVTVTVGGYPVVPDFSGLLVGSVTDYQVTFKVPPLIQPGGQPVTISVGGATSNTVTLLVGDPVPHINSIVNGATFKSGTAAANTFLSIFGSGFGSEDTASNIFPALTFNQVSVLVNSGAVPLYIVAGTKGQINFVLPSELGEFGTAFVVVTNPQGASDAFQLTLAPDSVGIFRIADPSDPGRMNGAVLFTGTAWKVMPLSMAVALQLPSCTTVTTASVCGQPAEVGDQVEIYLTGLGKATPKGNPNGKVLPTGSLAPADGSVLYETVQMPVVTVGGVQAVVSFSGIAPGSAGQYQINIAIPSGVEAGDSVPVTVTMPDGSKDTVTIAII
jgi:uncharacterized protein (TIGR03437 family)